MLIEKNYYWSEIYETSNGYVKFNFINILFMIIFGSSAYFLSLMTVSIFKVENCFFITLFTPLTRIESTIVFFKIWKIKKYI